MRRPFSTQLLNDVLTAVHSAADIGPIVNVSELAEEVRRRNETENVALEDIVHALTQQAQWLNLSIEFGSERP
jgi:hypothetical protein